MANLKIKENTSTHLSNIVNYVPGDIVCINSSTVPDGWLSCDGQTISASDYPDLYSALSAYYNATNGVIPDLNSSLLSFDVYPVGTIGNGTSFNASSANPTNTHTHAVFNRSIDSEPYSQPAHSHDLSTEFSAGSDNHTHGEFISAAITGSGYANIANNTANYDSAGTAGGISDTNHRHNYENQTSPNTDLVSQSHTHTISLSGNAPVSNATAINHSHTSTESVTITGSEVHYPVTYYLRFIIKV
jgi:microcystin-dependent protein